MRSLWPVRPLNDVCTKLKVWIKRGDREEVFSTSYIVCVLHMADVAIGVIASPHTRSRSLVALGADVLLLVLGVCRSH